MKNNLTDANRLRNEQGSARQVAAAQAALPVLRSYPTNGLTTPDVLSRYRLALRLRILYPNATLTELGREMGVSKHRYWRLLARALKLAEGKR